MSKFHTILHQGSSELLERSRHHRFLIETADGSVTDETFLNWLTQDYLWVREFVAFLAVLSARAPQEIRRPIADGLAALLPELDMFQRRAREVGLDLEKAEMSFVCHAYTSFLHSTAYGATFEEGLTLLYAAEYAYLDAWSEVGHTQKGTSQWQDFIDRWSDPGFAAWVMWLASTLDDVAEETSAAVRGRMKAIFRTTLRYELHFWEMAYRGAGWEP